MLRTATAILGRYLPVGYLEPQGNGVRSKLKLGELRQGCYGLRKGYLA